MCIGKVSGRVSRTPYRPQKVAVLVPVPVPVPVLPYCATMVGKGEGGREGLVYYIGLGRRDSGGMLCGRGWVGGGTEVLWGV
jgi:hypothetical protein